TAEVVGSEGDQLECAGSAADVAGWEAETCQWMLEHGHDGCRLEIPARGMDDQIEKGARHSLAERPPRRVVDRNPPALQPVRNAPREQAIWRDECGRAARFFECMPQNERDHLGF